MCIVRPSSSDQLKSCSPASKLVFVCYLECFYWPLSGLRRQDACRFLIEYRRGDFRDPAFEGECAVFLFRYWDDLITVRILRLRNSPSLLQLGTQINKSGAFPYDTCNLYKSRMYVLLFGMRYPITINDHDMAMLTKSCPFIEESICCNIFGYFS